MVDNIPVLTADQRNEARRLITLIDVLYEAQVLLAISAAAEPAALYMASDGAEAHDFARAVSRLTEMRTRGWVGNTPAGATLMASTYSP
jgi:cell division protein ZapE